MATFDEFYSSLDPDIGIRGKQFEKFVKWFLKTDPTWASQVDEVWLWNEYPRRWGADCGIDLIFTHKNGNTWAVQSKCVSPNNDIKKSEINSFLSESSDSKIDGRLLIASTDGIGKNAKQVINRQEKQVVCFLLEQFRQSEVEFPSSMEELNKGKRKEKKQPRPHQIEAIEKVTEGLKTADRGQVLMACGTGKTLTSLWIKEEIKAEQVLVLVPSLSLLSQTLKEWNSEANQSFKWICVCSDKSVAKDKSEDEWIANTSEIGVPVTSETLEVKNFLDENGSKVVFATYQSAQIIVEAQEHHDTSEFDLVIADEAHRCAGKVSDAFGSVLDENKIKGSKRLFFTATPRILSKHIKIKSLNMDFEFASMDDDNLFGEILYQLKFSEAIKKDLLSDYQVVVIGVDDEMIKQKIINRNLIQLEDNTILDAETIASEIAITKAIRKYKLRRIITFHSKIKNAQEFAQNFEKVYISQEFTDKNSTKISCDFISGKMKSSERNKKLYELKNLKEYETKILSNAKCLSEGVDVPALDGIAFINPKYSQIDIIQSVGRAIRKSSEKRLGIIIIPIYISKNDSLQEAILLSNFEKVWQIVCALRSQDDSLLDTIDKLRIEKGYKGITNFQEGQLDKFIFDIPEKITSKFSQSLKTLLIDNSSESWYETFGKVKQFYLDDGYSNIEWDHSYLGKWCTKQRTSFRKKELSKDKIKLLNSINFIWEPFEDQWIKTFEKLKEFFQKEGHSNPVSDKSSLGRWCQSMRRSYKIGKLSQEKITLLNSINFSWDPHYKAWEESFNLYKRIAKETNNEFNEIDYDLGKWATLQRYNYKKNKLTEEKIKLLESIGFKWDGKQLEELWLTRFKELVLFKEKNGHFNTPSRESKLSIWHENLRKNILHDNLSQERLNRLKSINYPIDTIKKDRLEEIWNEHFNKLKDFYIQNKNHDIPTEDPTYKWLTKQRMSRKENKLSPDKVERLNQINFPWDKREFRWFSNFNSYKSHLLVEDGNISNLDKQTKDWVKRQKLLYKKGILSQEKITLLETTKNWTWKFQFSHKKTNRAQTNLF